MFLDLSGQEPVLRAGSEPAFIMLCGVAGSGKSTFAGRLAAVIPGAVTLSSDARLEVIAARDTISYQAAYRAYAETVLEELFSDARRALGERQPVIWDQTHLKRQARVQRLSLVPDGYRRIAVALEAPSEIIMHRLQAREAATGKVIPPEVLKLQRAAYARPSADEGFDEVHIVRS